MLILALFLTLFSNHMEERLEDGKQVLRVDCRLTETPMPHTWEEECVEFKDETSPLLPSLSKLPLPYDPSPPSEKT